MKKSNATTANKTNKSNATVKAEAQTQTITNTTETMEANVNIDGLETVEAVEATTANANFSDVEWLAKNDPKDFFSPEVSTNKLNPEREPSIAAGLLQMAKLGIENKDLKLNPLVILLGKWWEVKPARAEIKKMIDKDAKAMGVTSDVYIQITLRSEVEKYIQIRDAADRLSYAINFYKPRRPLNEKVATQLLKIDGVVYEIAIPELLKAKADYVDDRQALKEYVLSVAVPFENKEVESL